MLILDLLANIGTAIKTLFFTVVTAVTVLLAGAAASVLAIGGVNLTPILLEGRVPCGNSP